MKIKGFLITGLIILLSGSVFAQENKINPNGHNIFYHENGTISSEGFMEKGKPNGYWKTYYENGVLKSEGNRKNFELDSTWAFYDDEGNVILEINYFDGKKNGIRRTIQRDEVVDENFVDDLKNGLTVYYYPEGKIRKTIPFINGLENGFAKEFNHDGTVISLIEYKRGFIVSREKINRKDQNGLKQGKWKYFYDDGNIRLEGYFKNDKKNGYFKDFDKNGNLIIVSKYIDGVIQEDVAELVELEVRTNYYPNGRVKTVASYKNNIPEGIRREYNEDGTIKIAYVFKEGVIMGEGIINERGRKEGAWEEYYSDKILKAEGNYGDGKRIGEWKFYFRNGKIEQTGNYNKLGKFDGVWYWYFPDEELLREESYLDGLLDGYIVEYDEEGNIILEGQYVDGYEDGQWMFISGEITTEGYYIDGMRSGKWKTYYSDGSLSFEGEFIDDNPNGRHVYYWDNHKVKQEGRYIMGRKEGDWVKNNYDGTPFLVISYKNGIEKKYDGIKIKPEMFEEDQEEE